MRVLRRAPITPGVVALAFCGLAVAGLLSGCRPSARSPEVPTENVVITRLSGARPPAAPALPRVELGVVDLAADRWSFGDPAFRLDPPSVDAVVLDGLSPDLRATWRRLRGEHELELIRRLDAAVARAGANASAALLVAAAYLHEGHADTERGAELFARALDAPARTESIVWLARVGMARALAAIGQRERALRALTNAVDAFGPETPTWAAWSIVRQLAEHAASEPAVEGVLLLAHRRAATVEGSGPRGKELRGRWLAAAYNAGDWKECLGAAVESVARSVDDDERSRGARAAAVCLDRLGGWERTPIGAVSAATYATILAAVAERAATVRYDLRGAERAWKALLERAPDTVEAPIAVARLAEYARRSGDVARARRLRDQGLHQYGLATPWATALRASRTEAGYPSAEAILRGVQHLLVLDNAQALRPTEADRALESRRRLEEAARLCAAHPSVRGGRAYGDIAFDVLVTSFPDRDAAVNATPLGQADELAEVGRCFRSEGPSFFAGAPLSVHAIVRVAP